MSVLKSRVVFMVTISCFIRKLFEKLLTFHQSQLFLHVSSTCFTMHYYTTPHFSDVSWFFLLVPLMFSSIPRGSPGADICLRGGWRKDVGSLGLELGMRFGGFLCLQKQLSKGPVKPQRWFSKLLWCKLIGVT